MRLGCQWQEILALDDKPTQSEYFIITENDWAIMSQTMRNGCCILKLSILLSRNLHSAIRPMLRPRIRLW